MQCRCIVISLFVLLISCRQNENKSNDRVLTKDSLRFEKEQYSKLPNIGRKKFDVKSLGFLGLDQEQRDTTLAIVRKVYLNVYQDTAGYSFHQKTQTEGTPYLYGFMPAHGHTALLIKGMTDGWVDFLEYRSYDLSGKFIDSFYLYCVGGDGGWYTTGEGKFMNDTTYIYRELACESQEEEGSEKCDTIYMKYIIHENGTIQKIKQWENYYAL